MRIIHRDGRRIFVFSTQAERREYIETLIENEQKRHAEAIRDIHSDFMNELKAENTYNSGTKKRVEEIESESLLEADVKESE